MLDVLFSERRTTAAIRGFFKRAIGHSRVKPERVPTDRAEAYPPMLRQVLPAAEHPCAKYVNNGIGRDHHAPERRIRPMRGLKR